MLTNPTLNQMQALGLAGMAAAWRELAEQDSAGELGRDEWLGLMLDREVALRADKRVRNRLAAAKLRFPEASIEDIDFATPRGLDRRNMMALAQGEWLKAHENLIVTGQTGTGKSWLACAIGRQAARLDHSVLYVRAPRLFEETRDVAGFVLAIGIDLQHVAGATARRFAETGQHRPALAAVLRQPQQEHVLRIVRGQFSQHLCTAFAGTIVHQQAGHTAGQNAIDHRTDRMLVVVHRDHHNGRENRLAHGASPNNARPLAWAPAFCCLRSGSYASRTDVQRGICFASRFSIFSCCLQC